MPSQSTQDLTLQGKVAIVTGSSRGIGAGLALELARRGAKITIVYTSPSSGASAKILKSKIEAFGNGSRATIVQSDLSQVDAPEKIVSETLTAFGAKIDILINNAGVLFPRALLDTTADDFAKIFNVNVRAALLLTKAVLPHLQAPGRIINISSVGARSGFNQLTLYCASKAALEGMTRCLASELGDKHTVNAVAVGPTESEMLEEVPEEIKELQKKTTPVQHRFGRVDDIAQIVAFLATESSRWVSGQTISASGGYMLL